MAFVTFSEAEREDAPPIEGSAVHAPEPHTRWVRDGERALLVPQGACRYEGLEETQLLTHAYLQELLAAHWLTGWAFQGYPSTSDLVTGTSDEATQAVAMEIVSASGNRLVLNGNPDRVEFGATAQAIPIGAQVEFVSPSVLSAQLVTVLTGIERLSDTTWRATCAAPVSRAMTAIDTGDPPSAYNVRIRWQAKHPFSYPRLEQFPDARWRQVRWASSTPVATRAGRVLPPWAFTDAMTGSAGSIARTSDEWDAALSVEPAPGGGWTSTLDVTALDATTFDVTCWAEDAGGAFYLGACVNDRADPRTPGERYCALASATRREDFVPGGCWIHGCSGFRPAESSNDGPGRTTPPNAPEDAGSAATWSALWTSESWVSVQTVPSVATFTISLPSGAVPSPIALCGSYHDSVDSVLAASRAPLVGPVLGRRIVDGSQHRLGTGLFLAAEDDDYTLDAGDPPAPGALAEALGATPTGPHPDGTDDDDGADDWICNLPGFIGGHECYDYAPEGVSLATDSAALDAPLEASCVALEALSVIDGVEYSHELEIALPGSQCDSAAIVTGAVESASTSGGNTVVVMRRAFQTFHWNDGGIEQTYQAACGGNIAATHEGLQLRGRTNAPRRGARLRDRVVRGDVATWADGEAVVVRAQAFADAPSTINWGEDDDSGGSPPTPPGRAPQGGGVDNWTSGDSRANWRDVVTLLGEHDLAAGTSLAFTRDAVHARRPTLKRANGEAVANSDWLWRPASAILLRVGVAVTGEAFTLEGGNA